VNDATNAPVPTQALTNGSRPPSRLKAFVILLAVAVVAYVGWHGAVRGWELQRRLVCAQNVAGVAASMKIYYGNEWDGRSPFIQWMRGAYPRSDVFLKCPSSGPYVTLEFPNGWPSEGSAIIAYEPKSNHGDGGNIVFADGHSSFVRGEDYDRLIAALGAGQWPPTKP
jgi:prepilin-type processing-associated H-X9-DG protein